MGLALAAHHAGITWVGLLRYLNFVQTPTVPKIEPVTHHQVHRAQCSALVPLTFQKLVYTVEHRHAKAAAGRLAGMTLAH